VDRARVLLGSLTATGHDVQKVKFVECEGKRIKLKIWDTGMRSLGRARARGGAEGVGCFCCAGCSWAGEVPRHVRGPFALRLRRRCWQHRCGAQSDVCAVVPERLAVGVCVCGGAARRAITGAPMAWQWCARKNRAVGAAAKGSEGVRLLTARALASAWAGV
jgi:hypothetical protein